MYEKCMGFISFDENMVSNYEMIVIHYSIQQLKQSVPKPAAPAKKQKTKQKKNTLMQ